MAIKIFATLTMLTVPLPFVQPIFAEAVGMDPLPIWGQFGIAGIVAFLHWWTVAKTIPAISQSHKDGLNAVAKEVGGLRTDLNSHMDSQIDLLKRVIPSQNEK